MIITKNERILCCDYFADLHDSRVVNLFVNHAEYDDKMQIL